MSVVESGEQVYEVSDSALPDFLARVTKLSRKSIKLLGKPIVPVFHGDIVREVTVNGRTRDLAGNKYVRTFHRVSVSGETPKIHGWTFVATIDHSHAAGNLLRCVPGAGELPEKYRTAAPHCDHCKTQRYRKDTFVLRSDAGVYMQIGRQCLRDFIGYDVGAFIESAKWLSGLEPSDSDGEGGYSGGGNARNIFLKTYLAHTHALIRTHGWVSKKDAEIRFTQSTASMALFNMFPPKGSRKDAIPLIETDHEVAEQAIAWAADLSGKTDYEYNLSIIAKGDLIEWNETGLAASMISGLFRHQEAVLKRAERADSLKNSHHIGEVGKRLHGIPAVVYAYRSFESQYGATHMYRMRTPQNDVLVWFASFAQDFKIGDAIVLDGTVKKHDVYEGIKQTVLTRCNNVTMQQNNKLGVIQV